MGGGGTPVTAGRPGAGLTPDSCCDRARASAEALIPVEAGLPSDGWGAMGSGTRTMEGA